MQKKDQHPASENNVFAMNYLPGGTFVKTRKAVLSKLRILLHPKFQCDPLSVALSPDAKKVAVGYAPYDVAIWDTRTGRIIHNLKSKNNWVVCLDFSPDGKLLASGDVGHEDFQPDCVENHLASDLKQTDLSQHSCQNPG